MTGNKRSTVQRMNYDPCYCGRVMEYTDDETAPEFCSAACRASYRGGYTQGMADERRGNAQARLDHLDTAIRNDS